MNLRVLIATDLSASATVATRLVAALNWPEATTIRVLGVVEPSHARDDAREERARDQPLPRCGQLLEPLKDKIASPAQFGPHHRGCRPVR